MSREPNPNLADRLTPDSSCYTKSTESRRQSEGNVKQTARILLEKRRQGKMTRMEQAYLGKPKKQFFSNRYHSLKPNKSDVIIESISSAHMNRIKLLENQISADQIKMEDYKRELRIMKTQQKRLEMELKRYENVAGNIPKFMHGHEENLRAVQYELKKAKQQCNRLSDTLSNREEELKRVKKENQRWCRLDGEMQLDNREKLTVQNEDLKNTITRQHEKIVMLTRKGELEVKNLKCELSNEKRKHRVTQQDLEEARNNIAKLQVDLETKQKYIKYNSLRFATHRGGKAPADKLESVSLITLSGNNFSSSHLKLDPELIRHYPKSPHGPTRTNAGNTDNRNVPSIHSPQPSSENVDRARVTNREQGVKRPPASSLPFIPSAVEDTSLSEPSELSEEDIEIYSSSPGSRSRKDSLLTDSRKSSPDLGSDSEEQKCSEKTRTSEFSLPGILSKNGSDASGAAQENVSAMKNARLPLERRVSINNNSLRKSKSQEQSPALKHNKGEQSQASSESRSSSKAERKKMPVVTRERKMAQEFESIQEKARVEQARSEAVKMHYEEYVNFNKGVKLDMDPAKKGKLLAALTAIDKGVDPAKVAPSTGHPRPATIFTSTRPRTLGVGENISRGRATGQGERPDSPPEHPRTKSELMKELFGCRTDFSQGGEAEDFAPQKAVTLERLRISDRNNNQPSDSDVIVPHNRVSLGSWKD